jgi:hypothetical protein
MDAPHGMTNQEIIEGFRTIINRWIAELREETPTHERTPRQDARPTPERP